MKVDFLMCAFTEMEWLWGLCRILKEIVMATKCHNVCLTLQGD